MWKWLSEHHERRLVAVPVAAALSALLVVGGVLWVDQHRALELRLAFAQAETSRLAGLLNALVARVDQTVLLFTQTPELTAQPDCDERLGRAAQTLPGAVTGFALVDDRGVITCSSIAALRGQRSVTAVPLLAEAGQSPLVSFIISGSLTRDPVIIVQRPAPGGRIVAAGLRVEALRLVATTPLAAALEDSRGNRVGLGDGRITQVTPSSYFPPAALPMAVTLPAGRRLVARISDHLAVTLDVERGLPADARAAALISTGWVFAVLAAGLAAILLAQRLSLLRPLRRLGEELESGAGTGGLADWLSANPGSPIRHVAARILARELNQEQRLALRDALLREVNHRVTGHLQMVVSLLRLQAREAGQPEVSSALRRAEHRVNTLALVHQGLHHALRGDRLDLLDLLRRVAVNLVEGGPHADAISLHVEGESIIVPPEIGVPVALVLNEWVTQALQDDRPPALMAAALWRRGAGAVLEYHDGGNRDGGHERSRLSLAIVEALSAQIGGHCERLGGRGWRLAFPVEADGDP